MRMGVLVTPTVVLAVALLITLFSLGAGGCVVLRIYAQYSGQPLDMPGSIWLDGFQALLWGTLAVLLFRYRKHLQRVQVGLDKCGGDVQAGEKQRL